MVTEGNTSKWDIRSYPQNGLNVPTSVKALKFGTQVSNGSAIRTFQIDDNFNLAYIRWQQDGTSKNVVDSDIVMVTKESWELMKGNLTHQVLQRLEIKLKTFKKGNHLEACIWAKKVKSRYLSKFDMNFSIAFKIDSKNQRRIQATFKIDTLYKIINAEMPNTNNINVTDLSSGPRIFNKGTK